MLDNYFLLENKEDDKENQDFIGMLAKQNAVMSSAGRQYLLASFQELSLLRSTPHTWLDGAVWH